MDRGIDQATQLLDLLAHGSHARETCKSVWIPVSMHAQAAGVHHECGTGLDAPDVLEQGTGLERIAEREVLREGNLVDIATQPWMAQKCLNFLREPQCPADPGIEQRLLACAIARQD